MTMPSESKSCPPDLKLRPDGSTVRADPKLLADGWVRRYLADPDRARESIELYASLGYEVRTEKLSPADFGAECQQCAAVLCHSYVLIYTRRMKPKHGSGASDQPLEQT